MQVWVLTGLVGFFIMLLMALFRSWLSQQSELLEAINTLKETIAQHNERLNILFHERISHKADIKEVERRVVELERAQHKCKNYEKP